MACISIIVPILLAVILLNGSSSVAITAANPRNWATFDPVFTHTNYEKQMRCGLAKNQLHVSLWALIWRRGLRGNCAAVWRLFCWQHWVHTLLRLFLRQSRWQHCTRGGVSSTRWRCHFSWHFYFALWKMTVFKRMSWSVNFKGVCSDPFWILARGNEDFIRCN